MSMFTAPCLKSCRSGSAEGAAHRPGVGLLVLVAVLVLAMGPATSPAAEAERETWYRSHLKSRHVDISPEHVLQLLKSQLPSDDFYKNIHRFVEKLGSNDYQQREQAAESLRQLGSHATAALSRATQSSDLEVSRQAEYLLEQIREDDRAGEHSTLVYALLKEAADQRIPGATPLALSILATLEDPTVQRAAQEAAWNCVQPGDRTSVEAAFDSKFTQVHAAAVVALERLDRQGSQARLVKYLKDEQPEIQLAACRALLPYQPQICLPVLIELVGCEEQAINAEAWKFLNALAGAQPERSSAPQAPSAWRKLLEAQAEKQPALRPVPDDLRLWWGSRQSFIENFDLASRIKSEYGAMRYRATVPGRAEVTQGRLWLMPGDAEGDQWLEIDALRAWSQPDFGNRFRVTTRLGGETANAGGYHAGIVVGNIKLAVHPGYSGGGVRAERDDTHAYLSNTESVGELGDDTLWNVQVDVEVRPDGSAKLVVSFDTDLNGKPDATRTYTVSKEDAGRMNRVALVRSGRPGSSAFFEDLQILPIP